MDVILSFRGSNTATVKDVNDLRKWLDGHIQRQLNRQMTETQGQLNRQMAETKRMFKSLMELDWCRSSEEAVPAICEPVKDANDLRKWLDGHIQRQLNRQMAETKRMFRSLMELDWCRSNEDTVPSICEPF